MKEEIKKILKKILPPIVIDLLKSKQKTWVGDFNSWEEASKKTEGYNKEIIIQTVDSAMQKILNREYVYERDSVLFKNIEYSLPALTGILLASSKFGKANILDFGGALGSTYWQNIKYLNQINFQWNIVEQDRFVKLGREKYTNDHLNFYESIGKCIKHQNINAFHIASTLQYLEDPYNFLEELIEYDFPIIILDRLSITSTNTDKITIQQVPSTVYNASYPCWFFSYDKVMNILERKYEVIEVFDAYIPNKISLNNGVKSKDICLVLQIKK